MQRPKQFIIIYLSLTDAKTKSEVKIIQSCLTLCDPMVYTVHGILQARKQEWVAVPFSRGTSQPRDWTQVSRIACRLSAEPQGKPKNTGVGSLSLLQQIFLTQKSNWVLLHCKWILYQLSQQGNPFKTWVYQIASFARNWFHWALPFRLSPEPFHYSINRILLSG